MKNLSYEAHRRAEGKREKERMEQGRLANGRGADDALAGKPATPPDDPFLRAAYLAGYRMAGGNL